jgi:fatty-acyl-CoA synthase
MALLSFWKRAAHDTAITRIMDRFEETPNRLYARVHANGKTHSISYKKLIDGAAPYAAACRERGLQSGGRVLVLFDHGPDILFAFFGAMLSGAVPSIMAPPSPRQDQNHFWRGQNQVINRIDAKLLFTTAKLKTTLDSVLLNHSVEAITPETLPDCTEMQQADCDGEDIAFLQHSSGTTGAKKGVMISHAALLSQIDAYASALDLCETDRIASWLPLYHDMGLITSCLLPVLTGVPVTLVSPFDWVIRPTEFFDLIERTQTTLVWQPNFAFQHLINCAAENDKWDLSSVRAFIDCSEKCRPETLDAFAERFETSGVEKHNLQTCYAMAESVFAVTQSDLSKSPRAETIETKALVEEGVARPSLEDHGPITSVLSCGQAIEGISLMILDDEGNRLPDRRIGEVCVSGPCLARGYDRQIDKTEAAFREGRYHTGDLGYVSDGELFVTGRKDDLLILNGRNHYAHDLEFSLKDVPGIIPGRVMALSHFQPSVGSDTLIVLAETREQSAASLKLIKKSIRDAMVDETGLVPAAIHLMPPQWLIKSTSGKISRQATAEKFESNLITDD